MMRDKLTDSAARSVEAAPETAALNAAHLLRWANYGWGLWRWVGLRGAGFPLAGLAALAAPACAVAADQLNDAESYAEQTWEAAQTALRAAIETASGAARTPLYPLLRKLKKGQAPGWPDAVALDEFTLPAKLALQQFAAALSAVEQAQAAYQTQFDAAMTASRQTFTTLAHDARLQEALVWQNRHAYRTALVPLRDENLPLNQRRRQSEELLANYWQRYCAKNDTIGFFGPMAWARLNPQASAALRVQPGARLLAARTVYFDAWCIDELARALAADPALRPWLAPQLVPTYAVAAGVLHPPFAAPQVLTAADEALLKACDGTRTAQEIAEALDTDTALPRLAEWEQRGAIQWTLAVPWNVPVGVPQRPEALLQTALARLRPAELRQRAEATLQRLLAARAAVAQAAGDAERLDAACATLEATFTELTGAAATRSAGKMYAGRTLVYEDCQRAVTVELGAAFQEALGAPLDLLLLSARWYVGEIASACRAAFNELYDRLTREQGRAAVDFLSFWTQAQPLVFGDKRGLLRAPLHALQTRWARILELETTQSCCRYRSATLREQVVAAFTPAAPAWRYARYHSPDVMLSVPAGGENLAAHDNFELVLGEFHVGTNSLNHAVFAAQHPAPAELQQAFAADQPEPQVLLVAPKYLVTQRTYAVFAGPRAVRLEFANEAAGDASAQRLPIGALVIEREAGKLIVRTRDGRQRFDVLEVFGDALSEKIANHFRWLPAQPHTPRLQIDRLIVARESWQWAAAELEFASEPDEVARFQAFRRWAAAHGLPRFLFYKAPVETKPCYLDSLSPVYVNLFAKVVRRTLARAAANGAAEPAALTVTEMLPTPEQVWLPDAAGQRYASEFRLVALLDE